jgi:hypothetical protein
VLYFVSDVSFVFFTKVAILRQIQRMKQVGWLILVLLLLISCNKKEEQGTCFDGVLSSGEHQVDCGGVCPPCSAGDDVTEFFLATINGVAMQFPQRTLIDSPSWIMNFSNDTLDVHLNFGNGKEPGAYPIEELYTQATMNGKVYDYLYDGIIVLAEIDTINRRLTGFFEAKLVGYFSNPASVDTLKISNGDFENIPY